MSRLLPLRTTRVGTLFVYFVGQATRPERKIRPGKERVCVTWIPVFEPLLGQGGFLVGFFRSFDDRCMDTYIHNMRNQTEG